MKLFRVRFTTEFEMTPFGEVPDILESSGPQNIKLSFISGGWNKGEDEICYHEWSSEDDPEIIKNFLGTRYGKSLVELCIQDLNDTPESTIHPDDFSDRGKAVQ